MVINLNEVATGSEAQPQRQRAAAAAGKGEPPRCDLPGSAASGCAGATVWLRGTGLLSEGGVVALGPVAAALTAAGARPSGEDDQGGTAGGGRPMTPTPGPAPSGASGGAAPGGAGVGLSGFLTLAGLLLLAAPRSLRRLRLACQQWRTAFFVLIPERPG
jgi:hypothetical protein